MRQRQLATGLGTIGLGVVVFLVLAASGALRHPAVATDRTHPIEFVAIGVGFVLLTVGVLATIIAYVEPSLEPQ